MSSYDCVLPVNWDRLWEDVIPAWRQTLTGRKAFESFCRELIPKGSRMLELGRLPDHIITYDTSLQGYLAPSEVEELAERLERLEILTGEQDDELFPLFAGRVRWVAAAGFELITMHGGL